MESKRCDPRSSAERLTVDQCHLQGIECFVQALQGTATEDQLARASAPRATRDVQFMLTALNSNGTLKKL